MDNPTIVLLFSGKRKSGKDFICEKIRTILGDGTCTIVRISEPLKGLYANHHGLDLQELLSDGPYKENYRSAMIKWSDEIRAKEPGYFCKAACDMAKVKPVWIVSDIRRITDVQWFKQTYQSKIKMIRIHADIEIRKSRGWVFTEGVDDAASECNLDDFKNWDLEISNNNDKQLESGIKEIMALINSVY
ncbi:phosphomevalonate kinase [Asbolus verrucosus]|uniref:Phosphomevalonate kinase n=1 Tax=Asbolus verrucosus TaxID=1661398 RepID=A0A482VIZ2_ASBVE|nr:phosphomevalonate kinase [Asbolus verrucosus]